MNNQAFRPKLLAFVCAFLTLAALGTARVLAQQTLVSFGSNFFSIDPAATTALYTQSESGLVFKGTYALGDTLGGTFTTQNWSSRTSFQVKMTLTGTNPNLPFSLQLYDAQFNIVRTYEGTTVPLVAGSPTCISLTVSGPGTGALTNVAGIQFTWDGGGTMDVVVDALVDGASAPPQATPSPSPSPAPSATPMPSPSPYPAPSATPMPSPSPSPAPSATPMPSPSPMDRAIPVLRVSTPSAPSAFTRSAQFTLRGIVSDDVMPTKLELRARPPGADFARWQPVQMSGSGSTRTWAQLVALPRPGTWQFQLRASDESGRVSPAATRLIVVDRIAPTATITSPGRAQVATRAAKFVLRVAVSDNTAPSRLELRIQPPSGPYGKWQGDNLPGTSRISSWSRDLLLGKKGRWTLQVRAMDQAGNVSAVRTVTITRQ